MATVKQRVHKFNGSDYDIIHYETEASVVLYTKNSQTNVEGALDTLFTDVAGKAASSHNHAASNITSGTLGVARGGTGASTFTSGAALIGAGTNAVTTKAIDSTSGGTANSASLITSGAVNAGLATKSDNGHTHTSSNITDFTTAVQGVTINASKITGVLSLDNIPASAQERVVTVADQAARFALTTSSVQLGDVVKQTDTGIMYYVTNTSKLNSADGYTEFTAGQASAVPWSGVTSKPSSFTPSSHTHGNITNDGKVGTTSGYAVYTTTGGAVTAGTLATTDPTASGTSKTFIDTISQDAKGKITATKKTVATMTAATADAAGTTGLVPAPAAGAQAKFLRADATWQTPTNTTYAVFKASGSTAASGLVPKPSTTAGTTKYLREDATWAVPPNTTYSTFVKSGSTAAAGLVPKPSTTAGTTKYLREDATWAVPPNTNTTYTFATGSTNGTISVTPSGGSASNIAVKGLGSAAYTASTAYAAASHNHAASNITSGTLGVARGGTGGADVTAAANSLQVVSLGNGTAIPNTADLDTYTTLGNYHCAATADAKKIKHVPGFNTSTLLNTSFGAFTMKVGYGTGTGYPCQTIIRYDTGVRYYRVQSSGTWGAWKEFAQNTNTTYTATNANIGSASGWSAGTAASASISSGVLTISNGTKPSLTVTTTSVTTKITAS